MPKYSFTRKYISSAGHFGVGQVIELDERIADWFNRDDPGCLEAYVEPAPAPEPQVEPEPEAPQDEERAIEAPPQDRMIRKTNKRTAHSRHA